MDAPYATLEQLESGIARVLAHNPSAFTYYGTQTYLIGTGELAVVDPGPDLPEHLDALEAAIGGRPVVDHHVRRNAERGELPQVRPALDTEAPDADRAVAQVRPGDRRRHTALR